MGKLQINILPFMTDQHLYLRSEFSLKQDAFFGKYKWKKSEYKTPKNLINCLKWKSLHIAPYPWESEFYSSYRHLFFFSLSIAWYMTKSGGSSGIYRCSVLRIWVKGQNAG